MREKCLENCIIVKNVRLGVLDWVGCTKCIIYSISLIIKK